jgi:hypothetical protein
LNAATSSASSTSHATAVPTGTSLLPVCVDTVIALGIEQSTDAVIALGNEYVCVWGGVR